MKTVCAPDALMCRVENMSDATTIVLALSIFLVSLFFVSLWNDNQ